MSMMEPFVQHQDDEQQGVPAAEAGHGAPAAAPGFGDESADANEPTADAPDDALAQRMAGERESAPVFRPPVAAVDADAEELRRAAEGGSRAADA